MNPLRVLLVEDNRDDAELAVWALREVGITEVAVAWDGTHALELLGSITPDLVLLDLRLPLMDGLDVLAEIRRDPRLKHLRVIILTSSENPRDMAACQALGVTAFLSKPLDGELLLTYL